MLQVLTAIYSILFGLCFGSFANVIIYRLPRRESIVKPPSRCPACGRRLAAADLLPVLSWLFLRGRCRYCNERVPWRYPVVELACASLFAAIAAYSGTEVKVIPLCALAFMLLCVSVIDIDTLEIPNGLLIFGAAVAVVWVASSHFLRLGAPEIRDSLFGSLAGALPLLIIDRLCLLLLKKDGFGFGDVKLMAVAGLYLGWKPALVSLLFAVVSGGIFGAVLLARRAKQGTYMAFGPFLSMGVLAALWFGKPFLDALFRV